MAETVVPVLNGDRIKKARRDKYLTQYEVADLCAARGAKIRQHTLSRIENNDGWRLSLKSLKTIPVLAEVLGMDMNEMFVADGDADAEAA